MKIVCKCGKVLMEITEQPALDRINELIAFCECDIMTAVTYFGFGKRWEVSYIENKID